MDSRELIQEGWMFISVKQDLRTLAFEREKTGHVREVQLKEGLIEQIKVILQAQQLYELMRVLEDVT